MYVASSRVVDHHGLKIGNYHPILPEVYYVKRGDILFKIEDKEVLVSEKRLLYITGVTDYAIVKISPLLRCQHIILAEDLEHCAYPTIFSSFFSPLSNTHFLLSFQADTEWVESLLEKLDHEINGIKPLRTEVVQMIAQLIVLYMYRSDSKKFEAKYQKEDTTMRKVQRYIEVNYNQKISVKQLATIFNLSPPYLSNAFKKFSGYSPQKYIEMNRILNAQRLLLSTHKSVKTIALECGFLDAGSFIRAFKRIHKISPNTWRLQKKRDAGYEERE